MFAMHFWGVLFKYITQESTRGTVQCLKWFLLFIH